MGQKSAEVDFGIDDDVLCDVQVRSSSSSYSADSDAPSRIDRDGSKTPRKSVRRKSSKLPQKDNSVEKIPT